MENNLVMKALDSFIKNNGVLGNVVDAFIKGYISAVKENSLTQSQTKKEKETNI